MRALLIALSSLSCFSLNAVAGFNEAVASYQAKDYATAISEARQAMESGDARASYLLGVMYQNGQGVAANTAEASSWYEKAAQGGVVGAFSKLAQLYARGDGVPKDADKALAYARRGDQLGDAEGSFFLNVILSATHLNYLDAAGKPDQAKYAKLATRAISERTVDVEARDALYRSAAKGYPLALLSLAVTFGETLGDGNRERMLATVAKIPNHTFPPLKNLEQVARHMGRLGQTYTSPKLFLDSQAPQMLAAMVKLCGIRDPKETQKPSSPELAAMSISNPITGAEYLPTTVAGNERSYLIAGEWEESWTYRGCGQTADVTVRFKADGLGGATFSSKATPNRVDAPSEKL